LIPAHRIATVVLGRRGVELRREAEINRCTLVVEVRVPARHFAITEVEVIAGGSSSLHATAPAAGGDLGAGDRAIAEVGQLLDDRALALDA
jgi:hypothetical protein